MNQHPSQQIITEPDEPTNNDFSSQPAWEKTKVGKSLLFVIGEALIPTLLIWLLTGKDISFAFSIPQWAMIVLFFGGLILPAILTTITLLFRLHKKDVYLYTMPISMVIMMLYISSVWWGGSHLLWRILIAFAAGVLISLLTAIMLGLVYQWRWKRNLKHQQ